MNNLALGVNSYALAGRSSPAQKSFVHRVRFQWPMALVLVIGVPLAVRAGVSPGLHIDQGMINSITIAAVAVSLAYFGWRRLHQFPGVQLAASALWSVGLSFGAAIAVVLVARLDYSRTVLLMAPFLTLGWLLMIAWVLERGAGVRIGVVPGGRVDGLPRSSRVEWVPLLGPSLAPRIDAYVADLHHDHAPRWEVFLADRTLEGAPIYHFKQVAEHLTGQVSIDHLSENSFGSVLPNLNYIALKRGVDLILLAVLAPLIVPLFAAVWLLIRLVDGGPALFTQQRAGRGGKPFYVFKFRTMRPAGPSATDAREAAKTRLDDDRVTPLGAWLRKTRIDEVAQVINIARGEMSWIGPRPEVLVLARHYERAFPFYRYRYAVRPGISGWAQVNQGHVVDDDDVRIKLRYDFYYVKNLSPWLDLLIGIKTLRIVLFGLGAR